ncbi:MAG: GGDEF domain-containing protein, partial [Lachnospiraceae bacterium]|nr:GGDEF domain-containing protein [Lachnospiraceae bacterium]
KYKPDTFIFPETDEEHSENVLSKPFRDRVLELTESGYPLIFNALDFMNRPFGFICFYFRNYFISNYSNSMNVTNAISIGFGGYINMRYQRSLLNKMDEMYRHDSLTGLYNRIGFQNVFKKLCKNPEYNNHTITVIMSDLDGLKYINDTFGHAEGDNAISTVAKALDNATPDSALCVRFGGDELFAVIFGECDTDNITDTITEYLKDYNETSGKPYIVSTSCGSMTTILDDNFSITQALKEADDKMYIIKKNRMGKRG